MTTKTESQGEAAAVGDDENAVLEIMRGMVGHGLNLVFSHKEAAEDVYCRLKKAGYLCQPSPAQGGGDAMKQVKKHLRRIMKISITTDSDTAVIHERAYEEARSALRIIAALHATGQRAAPPKNDDIIATGNGGSIGYMGIDRSAPLSATTDAPDMGDSLDRKAEGCASAGITSPTTPPTPAVQGLVKLLNNEIQVCANLEGMQNQDASIKVTPKEQHCNYALLAERIMRLITPSLNAAPLPPMTAWQPIDTAPKDGTEILVVCEVGFDVAQWNVYCDHEDGWFNASGEHAWKPTHWMPLPAEPLPAKATGEV